MLLGDQHRDVSAGRCSSGHIDRFGARGHCCDQSSVVVVPAVVVPLSPALIVSPPPTAVVNLAVLVIAHGDHALISRQEIICVGMNVVVIIAVSDRA